MSIITFKAVLYLLTSVHGFQNHQDYGTFDPNTQGRVITLSPKRGPVFFPPSSKHHPNIYNLKPSYSVNFDDPYQDHHDWNHDDNNNHYYGDYTILSAENDTNFLHDEYPEPPQTANIEPLYKEDAHIHLYPKKKNETEGYENVSVDDQYEVSKNSSSGEPFRRFLNEHVNESFEDFNVTTEKHGLVDGKEIKENANFTRRMNTGLEPKIDEDNTNLIRSVNTEFVPQNDEKNVSFLVEKSKNGHLAETPKISRKQRKYSSFVENCAYGDVKCQLLNKLLLKNSRKRLALYTTVVKTVTSKFVLLPYKRLQYNKYV